MDDMKTHRNRSRAPLSRDIIREVLNYNPDTGEFTWRERGRHWFSSDSNCQGWNTRFSGKRAGRVAKQNMRGGYQCRQVRLLGKDHLEHRLAWMWMTDEPLPELIDHQDRDATNNRWQNLRSSTRANNQRNRSMQRSNTSGVTGVHLDKSTGKWCARCEISGKEHHLGRYHDIDEAAMAVMEFRSENGFNPGHGVEVARHRKEVQ